MTPFTYHRPTELSDALGLLGEDKSQARVIAGGQSLLLWMKDRIARPERLMSVAALPGMKEIKHTSNGALEIGAATTYAMLAHAPLTGWHAEIAAVAGNLADRSVRSLGTIGGALCDANPRYDMPTLVVGADATLTISSLDGEREIKAAHFFDPVGGTILQPSDLLVSIVVPKLDRFDAFAFEKFRHRVFEAAVVTICCGVKLDGDGKVEELRIVGGAIANAPSLAVKATAALAGARLGDVNIKDVAHAVAAELLPESDRETRHKAYQAELVNSLTARALTRTCAALTGNRSCLR